MLNEGCEKSKTIDDMSKGRPNSLQGCRVITRGSSNRIGFMYIGSVHLECAARHPADRLLCETAAKREKCEGAPGGVWTFQ